MAGLQPQDLQTVFLEHMRSRQVPVTVFLVNGIKLQGTITSFDTYSVSIARAGHAQIVYKQAISTILPGEAVQLS